MNFIYSLILLIITPIFSFSQSVISNVTPNFGDEFVYNQRELAPSAGLAGANVTWDFSNEDITEFIGNYTVMTPEEVDGSEDFPDATMVWVADFEMFILQSFLNFNNNNMTVYGVKSDYSGSTFGTNYSNPQNQFTYPLSYQDSGSDNYEGMLFGLTGNEIVSGELSYTVDGYGTLITPFDTYENVLRIRTNFTETVTVFGVETVTEIVETTWYSPEYPVAVMNISNTEGGGAEPSSTITVLAAYTATTTGLTNGKNLIDFDIYPNPASDYVALTFESVNANSVLNIYSTTGKLVETKAGVQNDQKVDVSGLAPGIYIAVLNVDGQWYAQKQFSIVQ